MNDDLTVTELSELATYNAEYARGIMHTEDWKRYIAGLQARFNKMSRSGLIRVVDDAVVVSQFPFKT